MEIQETVSVDLRNLRKSLFEPVGRAQGFEAERVRRLEHDERLFALREQPVEVGSGARDGIAGNDQTLDGGIVGDLQRTVYSRSRQHEEQAGDPASRSQDAFKELNDFRRSRHTHGRQCAPLTRERPAAPEHDSLNI
jgi:hypothetical protein